MFIKTNGIVIKENFYSEKDKIITILTQKNGVLRAFAKGCRNIKHKNFSAAQMLNYSEFTLFNKNDIFTVNEASVKASFFRLRENFDALILAQYFCEVILCLVKENMESENILRLMLNSLCALLNSKFNKNIVKSVFEIRLLSILGYQPNLLECVVCKSTLLNDSYFYLNKFGIICKNCVIRRLKTIYTNIFLKLNPSVLAALHHSIYAEDKQVFSFTMNKENTKKFSEITQKCLLKHISKPLKTLKLWKNYSF